MFDLSEDFDDCSDEAAAKRFKRDLDLNKKGTYLIVTLSDSVLPVLGGLSLKKPDEFFACSVDIWTDLVAMRQGILSFVETLLTLPSFRDEMKRMLVSSDINICFHYVDDSIIFENDCSSLPIFFDENDLRLKKENYSRSLDGRSLLSVDALKDMIEGMFSARANITQKISSIDEFQIHQLALVIDPQRFDCVG